MEGVEAVEAGGGDGGGGGAAEAVARGGVVGVGEEPLGVEVEEEDEEDDKEERDDGCQHDVAAVVGEHVLYHLPKRSH